MKLNAQRELMKKNARDQRRMRRKEETQEEPRLQMKTHMEKAKEDYVNSHAI